MPPGKCRTRFGTQITGDTRFMTLVHGVMCERKKNQSESIDVNDRKRNRKFQAPARRGSRPRQAVRRVFPTVVRFALCLAPVSVCCYFPVRITLLLFPCLLVCLCCLHCFVRRTLDSPSPYHVAPSLLLVYRLALIIIQGIVLCVTTPRTLYTSIYLQLCIFNHQYRIL